MIKYKDKILKEAERFTGIDSEIIIGKSRKNDVLIIRDAVCIALKQGYGLTDGSIAQSIGRDRSTVSYAQRRHEKRLNDVPIYKALYEHLLSEAQKGVEA